MSTIKEHLGNILEETQQLAGHVTEANEFTAMSEVENAKDVVVAAIKDFELAVHEARKTFERTKEVE